VYSNHFVMCVLVNGQPTQELANGVVTLPFGTEYALRFRNKHNRRAVVKIYIDGENVSGEGYVVRANNHIDIKRHHDIDRSFKFVSLDSPDAVDHGKNGPNADKVKGTIEARFYLEKETPAPLVVDHHHHYHHHGFYRRKSIYEHPHITCADNDNSIRPATKCGPGGSSVRGRGMSTGGYVEPASLGFCGHSAAPSDSLNFFESAPSHSITSPSLSSPILKDGCTVEGNVTGQSFHTVSIDLETTYTSLKLYLQGHEAEIESAAPKRKTNKDNRVDDLEAENEELRRKLAELENAELKAKLAASKKTATGTKPKPKAKAKAKPRKQKEQIFDTDGKRLEQG